MPESLVEVASDVEGLWAGGTGLVWRLSCDDLLLWTQRNGRVVRVHFYSAFKNGYLPRQVRP